MTFFKALEELNKSILEKFPNNCMEYNLNNGKQLRFVMTPKLKENNEECFPLKKIVLKARIGDYLFLKDVEWYMLFQSVLDEQPRKCNLSDFPITSISKLFLKDCDWEIETFYSYEELEKM